MRNIILTVIIVFSFSALLYVIGSFSGLPSPLVTGLSGVPLLGIKSVFELFETLNNKRANFLSLEEFRLRPAYLIIISIVMFFGATYVTGVVAIFVVNMGLSNDGSFYEQIKNVFNTLTSPGIGMKYVYLIVYVAIPLRIVAYTYICRWVLSRSSGYVWGLAISITSLTLYSYIFYIIEYVSSSEYVDYHDLLYLDVYYSFFEYHSNIVLLIYSAFMLLSTIITGTRQQIKYLEFSIRQLPPETRSVVLEMIREDIISQNRTKNTKS